MTFTVKKKLEALESSMGNFGGVYSTTGTIAPNEGFNFNAIQIITDSVITCIGNVTGITSISFESGTIIYGNYTSITIVSGSLIAYQGVN